MIGKPLSERYAIDLRPLAEDRAVAIFELTPGGTGIVGLLGADAARLFSELAESPVGSPCSPSRPATERSR